MVAPVSVPSGPALPQTTRTLPWSSAATPGEIWYPVVSVLTWSCGPDGESWATAAEAKTTEERQTATVRGMATSSTRAAVRAAADPRFGGSRRQPRARYQVTYRLRPSRIGTFGSY